YATSVMLLVVLLHLSLSVVPVRRRTVGMLMGGTFVLLAKFYFHELELGQVNILMTVLVVWAAWQMKEGRDWLAGILIGCAIVVKPYALLLVPYLAARRKAAALYTMAAMLAGILAIPAAIYGFRG